MKKAWFCFLFLYSVTCSWAQNTKDCFATVISSNHLIIHGKTNINQFNCQYFEPIKDSMIIEVGQHADFFSLHGAIMKLQTNSFNCGNAMMNKDFKELLKSDDFPEIIVRLLEFRLSKPDRPTIGTLTAEFELAGQKAIKHFEVTQRKELAPPHYYAGTAQLDITEFGLEPPSKMMNLIKVNKMISVEFLLKLRFTPNDSVAVSDK